MIRNRLSLFLQGWVLIIVLIGGPALLIGPKIQDLFDNAREIERNQSLILAHASKLSAPSPTPKDNGLRKYVVSVNGNDATALNARIQSSVVSTVQEKRARLIEFSAVDGDASIAGLNGLKFRLVAEGDIEAVFGILLGLEQQSFPVLIEALDMQSLPGGGRADQNMRLSVSIVVWTRDIK